MLTHLICSVLYVCWKSRGSPAARGRISIELSMDDLPIEFPADPVDKPKQVRRGWWDYVPEDQEAPAATPEVLNEKSPNKVKGFFRKIKKSPLPAQKPKALATGLRSRAQQVKINAVPAVRNSFAPSTMSRLSRLIPRMELFRQVMRDEVNFYLICLHCSSR